MPYIVNVTAHQPNEDTSMQKQKRNFLSKYQKVATTESTSELRWRMVIESFINELSTYRRVAAALQRKSGTILAILVSKYGVIKIAEVLHLSRAAVTDILSGREKLTPPQMMRLLDLINDNKRILIKNQTKLAAIAKGDKEAMDELTTMGNGDGVLPGRDSLKSTIIAKLEEIHER